MTHRDRESEVVDRVAATIDPAAFTRDAKRLAMYTGENCLIEGDSARMKRRQAEAQTKAVDAIRETLMAMLKDELCEPFVRDFARSISISLSPQEKEGNE